MMGEFVDDVFFLTLRDCDELSRLQNRAVVIRRKPKMLEYARVLKNPGLGVSVCFSPRFTRTGRERTNKNYFVEIDEISKELLGEV